MPRRTKAQLQQSLDTMIVQNDTGAITASVVRGILQDYIDSLADVDAPQQATNNLHGTGYPAFARRILWTRGVAGVRMTNGTYELSSLIPSNSELAGTASPDVAGVVALAGGVRDGTLSGLTFPTPRHPVASVRVDSLGTVPSPGPTVEPTVVFDPPGAAATVVGFVGNLGFTPLTVTITNGGSYETAPTVSFVGTGVDTPNVQAVVTLGASDFQRVFMWMAFPEGVTPRLIGSRAVHVEDWPPVGCTIGTPAWMNVATLTAAGANWDVYGYLPRGNTATYGVFPWTIGQVMRENWRLF